MKGIRKYVAGMTIALASMLPSNAQNTVVNLDSRVYNDLTLNPYTTYVGSLPTGRVTSLQERIVQTGSIPSDIISPDYTIIRGNDLQFQQNTELTNVQIENLSSLGYLGFSNKLENSIIYSDVVGNQGIDVASAGNPVRNNIFIGLDKAIQTSDFTGLQSDITRNLIAFNDVGLGVIVTTHIETGENIFYRNLINARVNQANSDFPAIVEGNYWYDRDGFFLETEADILREVEVTTASLKSAIQPIIIEEDKNNYIDVVPFKGFQPFNLGKPLSALGGVGLTGLGMVLGAMSYLKLRRKN